MREFIAKEWLAFKGKPMAVTTLDREQIREDFVRDLNAEGFTIDGKRYTCLGVDCWAMIAISAGSPIAIWVDEYTPEHTSDG